MRTVLLLTMLVTAQGMQTRQGVGRSTFQNVLPAAQTPDIYGNISGEVIRETPHFQIYSENSFMPVDLDALQRELETIHGYLVDRLAVSTTQRFALTFRPPDTSPCPIRGLARFDEPVGQAIVFADERTSSSQVWGVLAHEISHLLHARVLRRGATDLNLTEGFATWAAGKYWDAWQGKTADRVLLFRREGQYKPLDEYYRETVADPNDANCLKNRDVRYTSFAAFIDFLVTDYGMDRFLKLLGEREVPRVVEGPPGLVMPLILDPEVLRDPTILTRMPVVFTSKGPPQADFKSVYGLSLGELEKVWLKKLDEDPH